MRCGRHRTYVLRRGRTIWVVVPHAGALAQGILIAQEIEDGGGVAPRHAHELGRGLVPMHDLVRLPDVAQAEHGGLGN